MNSQKTTLRTFLLLSLISLSGMALVAQPSERMERYRQERIEFFNDKLDLTEEESDRFWPLQDDLHNRMMKINMDEKNLLDYYSRNYDALSEKEIGETTEKFLDLQSARVDLQKEYHDQFVEIIGLKKTMRLYALDREFRMHVLRKFRGGDGHGRGRNSR